MNLIDEITNVSGLRSRLSASSDARSELLEHYYSLGQTLGFKSVKYHPVSSRGVSLGATPLAWLDEPGSVHAAFEVELSSEEKTAGALCRFAEFSPKLAVMVIRSSEQQPNLIEKFRNYLFNSKLFQSVNQNFLLLDISNGTFSLVEKSFRPAQAWERKKKIFGTRGMHKKQD